MATYKAIAPGFHVGRRRAGEVFEGPEGLKGSWFVPAGETEEVKKVDEVQTLAKGAASIGADLDGGIELA